MGTPIHRPSQRCRFPTLRFCIECFGWLTEFRLGGKSLKRGFPQKVSGISYYSLDTSPECISLECAVSQPESTEEPAGLANGGPWGTGRKRTIAMMGLALTVAGADSFFLRQPAAVAATNDSGSSQLFNGEAEAPAQNLSAQETHRVQPGETFWSIARRYNLTVSQLLGYNQLASEAVLRVDQVLRLQPVASQEVAPSIAPIVKDPVQQHLLALAGNSRLPAPPSAEERSVEPISSLPPQPTSAPVATEAPVLRSRSLAPVAIRPLIPAPETADTDRAQTYTVSAGDTLGRIAQQFGLSLNELLQANQLSNPNLIFVGQRLTIPAAGSLQNVDALQSVAVMAPLLRRQATEETASRIAANLGSSLSAEMTIETLSSPPPSNITSLDISAPTSGAVSASSASASLAPSRLGASPSLTIRPAAPEQVAVAPLGSENYEPLLSSLLKTAVAPELPSLNSDELLPSGRDRFAGYIWPARGILSSGYGWRWGRMHRGIDIAGPVGTPIVAAASGVVVTAGWNSGGFGNLVEIQHPNGSLTLYAHNHRILVRPGERVQQGQIVAEMGSTGRSTGPHLHFEVHPSGNGAVNPIAFLPAR